MGSAEDEHSDGEPKYAKLRPMRVEMYLCVHTGPCSYSHFAGTHKCIAADSGETTNLEMILAVQNQLRI